MTKIPTGRDLIPPTPSIDEPDIPGGLFLGIDIEELYCHYGESFQTYQVALGVSDQTPAGSAKHNRIRTQLWSLPEGTKLVRQLDDILAQAPAGEPPPGETLRIGQLLDVLMADVRTALPDDAANWYDLGVFLARLHLCLVILDSSSSKALERSRETYLRELHRVAPEFARTLLRLARQQPVATAPARLIRSLIVLAQDVVGLDEAGTGWYRKAREHADAVFAAVGMTDNGTNPLLHFAEVLDELGDKPDDTPDGGLPPTEAPSPEEEFSRQLARHREVALSGDPKAAEEGMRILLVTARQALGPYHPLIFMIRSDLSLMLLVLRKMNLCTDFALDAADDAAIYLGEYHHVTAAVALGTLQVLMRTASSEEIATFFGNRLTWLLTAEPDDLSEELHMVRDALVNMMITDESGATP